MEVVKFDDLYRETRVKIDGRVKTLSVFILLFTVTAMRDMYIPLALLAVLTVFVLWLRIPLKKLLYPLYVASVVFAVILFTVPYGKTIWHWWILRITQGSLYLAMLILVKVLVCISLLLVLVSTTKMYDIVSAFTWLPDEVVEITLLMLRYIETLSHTSTRLHMAARARGAFSKKLPFYKRISNLGSLAGVLILRAMDRAERVYTSMVARGYKGKLVVSKKFDMKTILQVIVVLILCAIAVYVDRFVLKAPYVLS